MIENINIFKQKYIYKNNLKSYINYNFQILFYSGIITIFDKVQIINQCKNIINKNIILKNILINNPIEIFKGMRLTFYKQIFIDIISIKIYLRCNKIINNYFENKPETNYNNQNYYITLYSMLFSTIIGSFILTPIEVARTKTICEISNNNLKIYKGGLFSGLKYGISNQGIKSVFNGIFLIQFNQLLTNIILLNYISNQKEINIKNISILTFFISSVCYPIDTIMYFN